MIGDEADADWPAGLIEAGQEEAGLDDGPLLPKLGRPRITDTAKMSRSTRYRRKAEERSK